jgi:hypothetical protein
MPERMIPVPESLIAAAWALLSDQPGNPVVQALDALLSQPTPTAEPPATYEQGCDDGYLAGEHHVRNTATLPTAEPTSVEDMAPGTTFTEKVRWKVSAGALHGLAIVTRGGGRKVRALSEFDPSTIHDVTPPA